MTHFDWNSDESVVLRQQPATAVQGDEAGDVWLRQEGQDGAEDQFIGIRRANVVAICKMMLRAAGHHHLAIVPVDEIVTVNDAGKTLRIPAEDLQKLDEIAEEMRLEEIAEQPRWARPEQPRRKDRTAADRKRKQRQRQAAERDAATVSRRDSVTAVTPRGSAPVVPRLPAELDLLQHGGAKQPVG